MCFVQPFLTLLGADGLLLQGHELSLRGVGTFQRFVQIPAEPVQLRLAGLHLGAHRRHLSGQPGQPLPPVGDTPVHRSERALRLGAALLGIGTFSDHRLQVGAGLLRLRGQLRLGLTCTAGLGIQIGRVTARALLGLRSTEQPATLPGQGVRPAQAFS